MSNTDLLRSRAPFLALFVLAACATEDPPSAEGPTYHDDVAPIVERRCLACHSEGGIGPMRLDSYADMLEYADLALLRIERGEMPPWMPDPSCHRYRDERLLTSDEIATMTAWVEGDRREGKPPVTPVASLSPRAFTPTHRFRVEGGYVPRSDRPDDYRCFLLDDAFAENMYVRASDIVPGERGIVHHVIAYAISGGSLARAERAEGADGSPGFTCFGGPFPNDDAGGGGLGDFAEGFPTMLAAWVPGNAPILPGNDTAVPIQAGSRIVMQVHYNTLSSEPRVDRTELQLDLTSDPPATLMQTRPAAVIGLAIPAGERQVEARGEFANYTDHAQRVGLVAGHMHTLGVQITVELLRGDDGRECLLDIPEWNFSWQQGYVFREGEEIVVEPGDRIRVSCLYDNSPAHQPVVNGTRLTPRDVSWGEGTLDEMCLAYLGFLEPFTERAPVDRSALACTPAADCIAASDSTLAGALGCEDPSLACMSCVLPAILPCAPSCIGNLVSMSECLTQCGGGSFLFGGPMAPCLEAECPDAYAALRSCVDEATASGACDTQMAACGIAAP